MECTNELFNQMGLHEIALERIQDSSFKEDSFYAPLVGAGSLVPGMIACEVVLPDCGHGTTAFGADH